jgi:ribonuclease-3
MAHPKGLLIERAQKLGLERPEFATDKTGPEHEPAFITDVLLDGEVIGTGQGRSKRDSEKAAAEEALAELTARESGGTRAASGTGRARAAGSGGAEAQGADEEFTGPWPMFDDLLASVVDVAERRVSADLRGDAALTAIRDFSLTLYKELLADLGEVVEEDEDEELED